MIGRAAAWQARQSSGHHAGFLDNMVFGINSSLQCSCGGPVDALPRYQFSGQGFHLQHALLGDDRDLINPGLSHSFTSWRVRFLMLATIDSCHIMTTSARGLSGVLIVLHGACTA